MKQLTRIRFIPVLLSVIAATTASAQVKLVTADESGNGNLSGTPLPSGMAVDPFSLITTLAYQLPFPGVPGDVYLLEANNPGRVSDVIRFDGNFRMYFFSDNDGPPIDPADVGLPPPVAALPILSVQEVGPEGNNGAFYTPNPGDPGDGPFVQFLSYHFISDVVPEPATITFLALGGLALMRRRRRENIPS